MVFDFYFHGMTVKTGNSAVSYLKTANLFIYLPWENAKNALFCQHNVHPRTQTIPQSLTHNSLFKVSKFLEWGIKCLIFRDAGMDFTVTVINNRIGRIQTKDTFSPSGLR